jgi:phosphoketolase
MKKNKVRVFIPNKFFDSITQKWEKTNMTRENWVEDKEWLETVKHIKHVGNGIIVVSWDSDIDDAGRPNVSVYKGILY